FREAILRRQPPTEDFALPLSGGRDSRHILLALCEAGHRPAFCVTAHYFPPGEMAAGDIDIARALTEGLSLRHVVLQQPVSRFGTEWRSNIETEFSSTDALWMLVVADFLKGHVRYIYDGIGGDVLSAGL